MCHRRIAALAVAGGAAAGIDGATGSLSAAPSALGLGLAAGALLGLVWAGLTALSSRMPGRLGALVFMLIGAGAGLYLSDALGAWARLDGPYRHLALGAIGVSVAGGLLGGLLLALLQPDESHPRGWLAAGRRRWAVALGAALVAVGLIVVDRTRFVGLYLPAHRALELSAIGALAIFVEMMPRPPIGRRVKIGVWVVALGLMAVPFVTLHRSADRVVAHLVQRPFASAALDTLRAVTDVDRDGLSSLLGGGDRTPFAAEPPVVPVEDIEPGALPPAPTGRAPTSVVLITIDTLRPDRMSLYGHERVTTPALDAFARDAVRFDRAYTPGGWTSLAISSMMRGRAPRSIRWTKVVETSKYQLVRWRDRATIDRRSKLRMMFGLPLDDPHPPLAEQLARRGMHTMAVVDDGYSQFLSEKMQADRGFADFRSVDDLPKPRRTDAGTTRLAIKALDARPADRPFFLWVHYFGPHDPSQRRSGVAWYGADVPDAYDHEVAFADKHVGRLLERVDAIAADEQVAVIITSDHGELFTERRRLHGISLHPTVVHIPMLLRAPGLEPAVSDAAVGLLDVGPTVLALTATPQPKWMVGRDLRETLTAPIADRVLFSDTWRYNRHGKAVYDHVAALDGRHILKLDRVRNVRTLFALDDRARSPKNLLGEVEVPHLEAGLARYLFETGGGRVELVE